MARDKRPIKKFKNIEVDLETGEVAWTGTSRTVTPTMIKHFHKLWRDEPALNKSPFPFVQDQVNLVLDKKNYKEKVG